MNHRPYGNGGTGSLLIDFTFSSQPLKLKFDFDSGYNDFTWMTAPHCLAQFTTTGHYLQQTDRRVLKAELNTAQHRGMTPCSMALLLLHSCGNAVSSAECLHTPPVWYLSWRCPSRCKSQIQQCWSFLLALVPKYRLRYKIVWGRGKIQSVQVQNCSAENPPFGCLLNLEGFA